MGYYSYGAIALEVMATVEPDLLEAIITARGTRIRPFDAVAGMIDNVRPGLYKYLLDTPYYPPHLSAETGDWTQQYFIFRDRFKVVMKAVGVDWSDLPEIISNGPVAVQIGNKIREARHVTGRLLTTPPPVA
jgi:hypothetical protein